MGLNRPAHSCLVLCDLRETYAYFLPWPGTVLGHDIALLYTLHAHACAQTHTRTHVWTTHSGIPCDMIHRRCRPLPQCLEPLYTPPAAPWGKLGSGTCLMLDGSSRAIILWVLLIPLICYSYFISIRVTMFVPTFFGFPFRTHLVIAPSPSLLFLSPRLPPKWSASGMTNKSCTGQ